MHLCWVLFTAEGLPWPVLGGYSPPSLSPGLCSHILSVFSCSTLMTVISAERDTQTGSLIQAKICFSTCCYLCEHPLPFFLSTVVLTFYSSPVLPLILFCSLFSTSCLSWVIYLFLCFHRQRVRNLKGTAEVSDVEVCLLP